MRVIPWKTESTAREARRSTAAPVDDQMGKRHRVGRHCAREKKLYGDVDVLGMGARTAAAPVRELRGRQDRQSDSAGRDAVATEEREIERVAALLAEPQPVPFGEPFKVVTASLSILPA